MSALDEVVPVPTPGYRTGTSEQNRPGSRALAGLNSDMESENQVVPVLIPGFGTGTSEEIRPENRSYQVNQATVPNEADDENTPQEAAKRDDSQFPEPVGTTRNQLLKWVPVKQFIEEAEQMPAPTWLINELIPSQGRVLVVAAPSSGKTWLALLAAKSSSERDVFIIEEEGSKRGIGERLKMMRLQDSRVHMLHLQGFKIDNSKQRAELVAVVKSHTAPVVILDPLSSLWSGDENDTQDATRLNDQLNELIKANPETLLLLLHHMSKGSADGKGTEINAGRGSSTFPAWADVILNLRHIPVPKGSKLVEFGVTVAKHREGERGYESKLKFNLLTGEVEASDAPAKTADDLDAKIIAVLKKSIVGMSKNAIVEAVKRKKQTVNQAVDRLWESDVLQLTNKLYSLKPKAPNESE